MQRIKIFSIALAAALSIFNLLPPPLLAMPLPQIEEGEKCRKLNEIIEEGIWAYKCAKIKTKKLWQLNGMSSAFSSAATLTTTSTTQMANAGGRCVPTTDKLYLYDFVSRVEVTNHGGVFDSSKDFQFDYRRNCQVSPILKILVRDKFGTIEYPSSGYGSYETNYTNLNTANCWQLARVSAFGQSEWSNEVCYKAKATPATTTNTTALVPSYSGGSGSSSANWLGCYFKGKKMWGKVYVTPYSFDADVKVYQTPYSFDADLKVFNARYSFDATTCGKWYVTPYSFDADFKVYFSPYSFSADFKIYTTPYSFDAGR